MSAGPSSPGADVAATVVVPTYNRAHLLGTCLRGLIRQRLPERYEVLVVDDGSTDHTWSVVQQARDDTDGRVDLRYEWQPNSGINAGRNRGVASARSDLVCFVDDDVDVPNDWLAALVGGARAHPEADVLGGSITLRLEGRAPRTCGREQLPETKLDHGSELVWDEMLHGANFAVRKAAVERVGGFDASRGAGWVWGDEQEFERRILAGGGHTLYLPDAGLWHRRTPEDLKASNLLRKEFIRGRTQAEYAGRNGGRTPLTAELMLGLRGLYHTVRRRCFTGPLICARVAGHLAAMRSARPTPSTGG